MQRNNERRRLYGWAFPARTSAYFLIVATASMAALAYVNLQEVQKINAEKVAFQIERAAQSAVLHFSHQFEDFTMGQHGGPIETSPLDSSNQMLRIDSIDRLEPNVEFDSLVDSVADLNEGAANIFRFDQSTGQFDRISTSFKDADGLRIGGSQVEPGVIGESHPAYASLIRSEPFMGAVPVNGKHRCAFLTPIVDADSELIGVLAVDIGWVDDLFQINSVVANRAVSLVLVLLGAMFVATAVVMFMAFRPLRRLIKTAHDLGSNNPPESIPLTNRRDEIGDLADGLSLVVDLRRSLEYRAYTDQLTDVPNRGAFVRELDRRIAQLAEGGQPQSDGFALLILDLDGFKEVNDGLGHQAGDQLLVSIAASMTKALQPGEFFGRLGGDEFALMTAPGVIDVKAVDAVAQGASASVAGVRQTHAGDTSITASIGVALVSEHGMTAELALHNADLALYAVKRDGRGHAKFYDPQLSSSVQRHTHLATQLRQAMADGVIRLEYQPIYDAMSGQIRSVEALARWTHEVEGEIPPLEFVRAAMAAGLMSELGDYVIEQVCTQIARWRQLVAPTPVIAVNVSTMQLWRPDFVERLRATMQRHEIGHGELRLELSENVVIEHENAQHRDVLNELAALGTCLSIDNFGTGSSSLSYLHDVPVDQVKIDRAFLVEAASDEKRGQLFAGIVALAHNLGLAVVAEGVETTAEFVLAKEHGCDLVQGFYLDSPKRPEVVSSRFGQLHSQWPLSAMHGI